MTCEIQMMENSYEENPKIWRARAWLFTRFWIKFFVWFPAHIWRRVWYVPSFLIEAKTQMITRKKQNKFILTYKFICVRTPLNASQIDVPGDAPVFDLRRGKNFREIQFYSARNTHVLLSLWKNTRHHGWHNRRHTYNRKLKWNPHTNDAHGHWISYFISSWFGGVPLLRAPPVIQSWFLLMAECRYWGHPPFCRRLELCRRSRRWCSPFLKILKWGEKGREKRCRSVEITAPGARSPLFIGYDDPGAAFNRDTQPKT